MPASNPSRFEALGTLVLRHCDGIDATCQLSAFQRIREDPFELTPPTFGHCYLLNDKGELFSNSGGDKKRKVKVT